MNFDLSDDQKMLQDQARRYLSDHVRFDALRAAVDRGETIDAALWKGIAELGWPAVAIPEEFGGLGLGFLEQCVIVEELGRSVAPVPFVSSVGLGARIILRAGSAAQQARWLPALASGEAIAGFTFFEGAGPPDAQTMQSFATTASAGALTGRKWPVLDAGAASLLVVVAREEGGSLGLYVVETGASGLRMDPLSGFDQMRGGWSVDFDRSPGERLEGDAAAAIAEALDVAATLTAFEQVGGAEAALEMARNYSMERRAFGRQIGSFQAIKHRLADMLTNIELARSNAYYAGWALANQAPDRALAAATARVSATEAYEFAARENMQVHGGISFTWEADCHFHYRRSRLLAVAFGSPRFWNGRIVDELLAVPAAAPVH